jgi:hypothetical protein
MCCSTEERSIGRFVVRGPTLGFGERAATGETAPMSDATGTMDPKVEWLAVVGDADIWRSLGLTVTDDGVIPLVGASIRLVPASDHPGQGGIVGWALSGAGEQIDGHPGAAVDVDGLSTLVVAPMTAVYADHRLKASGLDHVVVLTADLERTSAAIAEVTGCELKRIREVGTMRQGFHRIGHRGARGASRAGGPGELIVEDLDAACELSGPAARGASRPAGGPGELLGPGAHRRGSRRGLRADRARPHLGTEGCRATGTADRHDPFRRRPRASLGVCGDC